MPEHSNALDRITLQRSGSRAADRAEIIEVAADQVLHRGPRAAVWNFLNLDTDQVVEELTVYATGRADAGGAQFDRGLVLPHVGDDVLQVIGRTALARQQNSAMI